MADTLGITPYSPAADINFGNATSSALQSLGAQLRSDMTAIQTNRQVKNLGSDLSQLDPETKEFPAQLLQAAIANPLGATHPVGKMAIATLGAAHKAWQAETTAQYGGFGSGGILNRKTGEVLREPDPKASAGGAPYSSFGSGGVLNRQTGEVLREPSPRVAAITPEQKAFEAEKTRIDSALLKTQTSLNQAAGGEDVSQLATASKVYRVDSKGTQDNNGENVILEFPDGSKKQLTWKDFSKIHGHYTALEQLKAQRAALQLPVAANPLVATPKTPLQNGLPSMESISNPLMPDTPGTTKPLDAETAKALLQETGGDKAKARALAVQRGYSL